MKGIYAGPPNRGPNSDIEPLKRVNTRIINPRKVWILAYEIFNKTKPGKGTAVVVATNAEEAVNILRTNGQYNGTDDYNIQEIQEVNIFNDCSGLMAEMNISSIE